MAKAKIDKVGLVAVLFWLVVIGALYYFGYTTSWGAELLRAVEILFLFWSFLSPAYLLVRMSIMYLQSKRAARLGLTLAQYQAERRRRQGKLSPEEATAARRAYIAGWGRRALRIAQWELGVFSAFLILFGILAERWRHIPGGDKDTALGMSYALLLYTFLGMQVMHRVWARWHHRLAPGSAPPGADQMHARLAAAQIFWNVAFSLSLLFAMVELLLSGSMSAAVVLTIFAAPALGLLLLAGLWRMLRPLFRHRHTQAA